MKHLLLIFAASLTLGYLHAESLLIPDARVAVIGDSITEQKLYSKYIECYLLACTGRQDIHVFQFGWSGERADGFAARLENDLAVFNPNVATTCYGMNDGSYQPYNDTIGGNYERNMRAVIAGLKKAGVQKIAVGSPGGVDPDYFNRPTVSGDIYNQNLAKLRDIAQKLAGENGLAFANVHDSMMEALPKSKAALGKGYGPFGGDGFHPSPPGQLLMASAFLKALGVDGNIGEITLDWETNATSASAGHELAGGGAGSKETQGKGLGVMVKSTRWPFCFDVATRESGSNRSILPFCDFNEKLNRLTFRVKNFGSAKAKVTWGSESKEFTREQLAVGINLAAEFPATPFDTAFMDLMNAVGVKQAYETVAIKNLVTHFRNFADDAKSDAELAGALGVIRKKVAAKNAEHDFSVRKRLKPVEHQIWVSVVN